jgi:hypothetical protein
VGSSLGSTTTIKAEPSISIAKAGPREACSEVGLRDRHWKVGIRLCGSVTSKRRVSFVTVNSIEAVTNQLVEVEFKGLIIIKRRARNPCRPHSLIVCVTKRHKVVAAPVQLSAFTGIGATKELRKRQCNDRRGPGYRMTIPKAVVAPTQPRRV